MSALNLIFSIAFLNFFKWVDAKTCLRSDDMFETFQCSMYEYCCGTRCCRSPFITFYHLWYFWFLVFLTMLFCSGGGYWYRLRNQSTYITPTMASRIPHTRHMNHPVHGTTIYASSMPMSTTPRVTQYPQLNAGQYPPHYPLMTAGPYPTQPPPSYYGPPPSYEAVVNQNPPQNLQTQNLQTQTHQIQNQDSTQNHQSQNQDQNLNQNQRQN